MDSTFDLGRKFVRLIGTRSNGLIEFEFSVGSPDLAVELIMPRPAFEAFCAEHQVELLDNPKQPESAHESASADFHWSLHQATQQRFRAGD